MEDKIKYVLNGETKYYTYEGLKAYYIQLFKNSEIYIDDNIDDEIEHLIKTLKEYDGDPYGGLSNEESRQFHHRTEARGFLHIVW